MIDVDRVPPTWVVEDDRGAKATFSNPPIVSVGDPMVAFGLLRRHLGIAFLPDIYAEPLVEAGELARLLPAHAGPAIEVYLSFPPRRSSVPAVRLFIDLMVAECERLAVSGTKGPALAHEPVRPAGPAPG